MIAAYRWTHSTSQVAWFEGRRLLGAVLHSPNELSELGHDDSNINIVMVIIIIIIIRDVDGWSRNVPMFCFPHQAGKHSNISLQCPSAGKLRKESSQLWHDKNARRLT